MIRWEEPHPGVALAIIDRDERRNALNAELCDQLRACLEAATTVRAIVLTGEGSAFCAGADLARRASDTAPGGGLEPGGHDSFRPAFDRLLEEIVHHPAPVIAAVNGPALGAGMQLAVACDLRVVGPKATFGIPAARLGVLLNAANIRRLALLVGYAAARDLLLTACTLDRPAAASLGLVQRAADDVRAGALELARQIAALAPLSVSGHKEALNLVFEAGRLPEPLEREIAALETRNFESDDLQEGLAAFAERRRPAFRGR